jgi:hypothetical protein
MTCSLLVGDGDGIAHVDFIMFIFANPAAVSYPEMKLVIDAIVVYWDVWVSASDHRLIKQHFECQIMKKKKIVNACGFHVDHHVRSWVFCLLDLTLDCSKSVVMHPLLVALQ